MDIQETHVVKLLPPAPPLSPHAAKQRLRALADQWEEERRQRERSRPALLRPKPLAIIAGGVALLAAVGAPLLLNHRRSRPRLGLDAAPFLRRPTPATGAAGAAALSLGLIFRLAKPLLPILLRYFAHRRQRVA